MIRMDDFLDVLLVLTAVIGMSLIVIGLYLIGTLLTLSSSIYYIFRKEYFKNNKENDGEEEGEEASHG